MGLSTLDNNNNSVVSVIKKNMASLSTSSDMLVPYQPLDRDASSWTRFY
jgi:hypothetical protein